MRGRFSFNLPQIKKNDTSGYNGCRKNSPQKTAKRKRHALDWRTMTLGHFTLKD